MCLEVSYALVFNLHGYVLCLNHPFLNFNLQHTKKYLWFLLHIPRLSGCQNHCNYTRDNVISESGIQQDTIDVHKNYLIKTPMFQKGVLRTNCIDCLDRTNVAQCMYGWAALLHQLHALGYIDAPRVNPNGPLEHDLIRIYERMGNSLSWQYGGSPAQNKVSHSPQLDI